MEQAELLSHITIQAEIQHHHKEDIESYNRLKEAGKLIGINVLDSIIVGESYYSFHENGI